MLKLHVHRANIISRIWKTCKSPIIPDLNHLNHGWDNNYKPKWSDVVFPHDISEFIADVELEGYILDDDVVSDVDHALLLFLK